MTNRFARKDLIWGGIGLLVLVVPILLLVLGQNDDEPSDVPDLTIIFLAPTSADDPNLHLLNLGTGQTTRLTDREEGLVDYAVSPNGEWVAYTSRRGGRATDIWAINVETRQEIQLTNCVEAQATCEAPAWRADSQMIAYTRRELSETSGWFNTERVWLTDLATQTSRLLFEDTEIETRAPQWSPLGERIAVAAPKLEGVLIYDFPSDQSLFVSTQSGLSGNFSPDGNFLIYPVVRYSGTSFYTHLELVEFNPEATRVELVSGSSETPVEDIWAVFHPNGRQIALLRRYLDARYTQGAQVYLFDLTTRQLEVLVNDPIYTHGSLHWSPDGGMLVMQRYNLETAADSTEIWTYELTTGEFRQVVVDGFAPRFVP